MGYSPPKKQLDLKEFLSQPAKKRPGTTGFGRRRIFEARKPAQADDTPQTGPEAGTATGPETGTATGPATKPDES